LLNFVAL
jgi:centrosomal protein CEP76